MQIASNPSSSLTATQNFRRISSCSNTIKGVLYLFSDDITPVPTPHSSPVRFCLDIYPATWKSNAASLHEMDHALQIAARQLPDTEEHPRHVSQHSLRLFPKIRGANAVTTTTTFMGGAPSIPLHNGLTTMHIIIDLEGQSLSRAQNIRWFSNFVFHALVGLACTQATDVLLEAEEKKMPTLEIRGMIAREKGAMTLLMQHVSLFSWSHTIVVRLLTRLI